MRSVTAGNGCRGYHLVGRERADGVRSAVLITPFDHIQPARTTERLRQVSRAAWVARLRELLLACHTTDAPSAAAGLPIALLPYQLEPLLVLLCGEATRVLLADHVGLGKTIQAGLIVREFMARGDADRVLIVTPAGLRNQWAAELADRLHVRAEVCDSAWLERRAAALPPAVSPWSVPGVRVVSLDLLKRTEVLNGLQSITWDLLVVDEAHQAAAGTDRGAAVHVVARRARRVVLATAIPHDGSESRFDALCALGQTAPDDRVVIFRRTPAVLGHRANRRSRVLRVTGSGPERRMRDLLAAYARAVCAAVVRGAPAEARLALSVLLKRSYSSARALELTARRRRALLERAQEPTMAMGALPFDEGDDGPVTDDSDAGVLGVPGLPDARYERAWLGAVAEAAHRAAREDRKLAAIQRLIERTREPVIVFTEFRDTLSIVARSIGSAGGVALVHGGQSDEERRREIDTFVGGHARVLLATDAASEGLNLQARCRAVVHVEIPWNPNRLEQRVGRVDRIGQGRPVHELHLVARHTAEEQLWSRLERRRAVIRDALDASARAESVRWDIEDALGLRARPDVGHLRERQGGSAGAAGMANTGPERSRRPMPANSGTTLPGTSQPRPSQSAVNVHDHRSGIAVSDSGAAGAIGIGVDLLHRIAATARIARRGGGPIARTGTRSAVRSRNERPLFARITSRRDDGGPGAEVVLVYEATFEAEERGPCEVSLLAIRLPRPSPWGSTLRSGVEGFVSRSGGLFDDYVRGALEARRRAVERVIARRAAIEERRMRSIARCTHDALAGALVQRDLFGPLAGGARVGPDPELPADGTAAASEVRVGLDVRLVLAGVLLRRGRHAR